MQLLNSGVLIFIHSADMCIFVMVCVSSAFNKHQWPTATSLREVGYFSPKFKKVKKDSLKVSSKIRLIVKSLSWICIYFLPQFQNNYQKIGPCCTFTMHYDRKQSRLVGYGTQLIWGPMTSLHNSVRTLTTLKSLTCSIPCFVPSLHYFYYFTAAPNA